MTIKELREKDAIKLATRENPAPTNEEIEAARHAMRLFYRFAASYQRSFYTEQDNRATDKEKEQADAKSEKAYKKASDALRVYNLKISCPGLYPIIEELNGINFTYGHFYN